VVSTGRVGNVALTSLALVALIATSAAAAPAARPAAAHPLHTTLTELTYDVRTQEVLITVRVFADDLAADLAAGHGADDGEASDATTLTHVAASLGLADRAGHPLVLRWRGARRTGDLRWLYLAASAPGGLAGLQVTNRLLVALYPDQVNIVQAVDGGRRSSLLFTRGDGTKRLP
jgi:hypothetical protein